MLLRYRQKESHDCSQSCYNNTEKYLCAYRVKTERHINIHLYWKDVKSGVLS
jgi:hypothetical protein